MTNRPPMHVTFSIPKKDIEAAREAARRSGRDPFMDAAFKEYAKVRPPWEPDPSVTPEEAERLEKFVRDKIDEVIRDTERWDHLRHLSWNWQQKCFAEDEATR